MKKKMLIVYYSISNGNTRRIAERMQKATDADIVRIETVKPYTGSYNEIVDQGQREVNRGYQPELEALTLNPADYDVIAVGTPTWWYTMAPAVLSFLKAYDWNGKEIIPFQTHGGWPGHVMSDIKSICKGAVISHEMAIQFDSTGGAELVTSDKNIDAWLAQIKKEVL
ncbi:MAG: NAD(P)H-dependent oxidoreductase [Roseburia sp.]|nr:NAD(P)H-dependent oxidoreductase [Roseburia sp.]